MVPTMLGRKKVGRKQRPCGQEVESSLGATAEKNGATAKGKFGGLPRQNLAVKSVLVGVAIFLMDILI